MNTKQIVLLVAVPLTIFAVCTGLFWWMAQPDPDDAAAPPAYVLGAEDGRLALFKTGEDAPVARYDVYVGLLPETDAEALQNGIPVSTREELNRYLEDFGA